MHTSLKIPRLLPATVHTSLYLGLQLEPFKPSMFPPSPSGFCPSSYRCQERKWIPAYLEFSGAQVAIIGSGVQKGIRAANFGKIPPHWEARYILNSGPWARVLATPEVDDHGLTRRPLPGVHYEVYAQPDQAEFTRWMPQQVKFVQHNREPLIAVATDTANSTDADYILLSNFILPVHVGGNHDSAGLHALSLLIHDDDSDSPGTCSAVADSQTSDGSQPSGSTSPIVPHGRKMTRMNTV